MRSYGNREYQFFGVLDLFEGVFKSAHRGPKHLAAIGRLLLASARQAWQLS
jgi:hypothetical protein